jgi:hypothetical protein
VEGGWEKIPDHIDVCTSDEVIAFGGDKDDGFQIFVPHNIFGKNLFRFLLESLRNGVHLIRPIETN